MKLCSWNVNGIRAVLTKGAPQMFIDEHDPDVLCLQETKAERGQFVLDLPQYDEHFFSAMKKGYSGTAIFAKTPPIRYIDGFPAEIIEQFSVTGDSYGDPNAEGRVIAAEFDHYWVVTVYTPNSKGDLSRLELRYKHWDPAFLAYVQGLESGKYGGSRESQVPDARGVQGDGEQQTEPYQAYGEGAAEPTTRQSAASDSGTASSAGRQGIAVRSAGKPVLFCGDLNVAHQEIDLANPKSNVGKHGFTDEERERFGDFLAAGYVDTFRAAYPDQTEAYTWWTHWANARARNVGWRIDYWLASASIAGKVKNPQIHANVMGSDHCPISIEL